MRTIFIPLAVSLALTSVAARAQQPPASAPIAPGTLLQVEMSNDVDAKKAHPGDVFKTRLWDDVRNGDKVVLPAKTVVVGHVVAAQPHTKDNSDSSLSVAFDKAILKSGAEIPLHCVVERVQLSQMAAAAAAGANGPSYNQGLNPGSTTNIAMPAQQPQAGEGPHQDQPLTPGPTNIRDTGLVPQADPSGNLTVIGSAGKSDAKLKKFATLDVRVTRSGE